jgi:hypothetical protein
MALVLRVEQRRSEGAKGRAMRRIPPGGAQFREPGSRQTIDRRKRP